MALANGPTIVAPTAGQVLAEQVFPWPRSIRVMIVLTGTYNFDAILEVWDGDGRVTQDMVLSVAAPMWSSPTLGPFTIPANGRLRIINRDLLTMPGTHEVQASIFWRDWAER